MAGNQKVQDRQKRQLEVQLAKRAERAAKKRQTNQPTRTAQVDTTIKTFTFVRKGTLDEAFFTLKKSATLQLYFPRYRYEDNIRRAVAKDSFSIEAPFAVIQTILRELQPAWQFGKAL